MRRDMLSSEYPTAKEEEEKKQEKKLEGNPTPLWRLFREASCEGGVCRDIAERHVISKLNETDVKFFYDANSETRALIKRAARSGITLAEKFRVCEMFSISTLEFAWENVQWNTENKYAVMNQPWFCWQVAETNKLELLKWAREEKKCDWDARTIKLAADIGIMEMLKYCVANECPVDEYACAWAASNGHLECLKYLHKVAKAPWDWSTAAEAARNGHLHILEYLVEQSYDKYDNNAFECAVLKGHLDCLKFLHEVAKAPWDGAAVRSAHRYNHPDCLQYLLDNDCPLPIGWRDWL